MKHPIRTAGKSAIGVALLCICGQTMAKDVVVHLFEWRWNEIAQECEDFLGPKGYQAVQISPPNEHVNAPGDPNAAAWWLRYQPVSYTNLTSRSGTEAELQDMIQRCKAAGVEVIADAVFNQMGDYPSGSGIGSGGSAWNSNNADYPDMDGIGADFHTCGNEIDWHGTKDNVWDCRLEGMPDINTGNPTTQDKLVAYLSKLKGMGVYGFRIDAAKSIRPGELDEILDKAGKPWAFLEVIDNKDSVGLSDYDWMDYKLTEFGYATKMRDLFVNGQIKWLSSFGDSWMSIPGSKALVFITNHDRERGHGGGGTIHYDEPNGAQNLATVFMLAHPYGTPKIHSGFRFSDENQGRPQGPVDCDSNAWICQHRWGNIANMVGFRNQVGDAPVVKWWDNANNQIAFGRGDQGFVVINNEPGTLSRSFETELPEGNYCDVLSNANECDGAIVSVDSQGKATITVKGYSAAAIHRGFMKDAADSWSFRGTPNQWGATAMEHVSGNEHRTCQSFGKGDDKGGPRFKIDHRGDWQESYPAGTADYTVTGNKSYEISFYSDSHSITTAEVADCANGEGDFAKNLASLAFRGTANGWATTPMKLVADNTWEVTVSLDGQANQRFKLDVYGNWSLNYGDDGADGFLDQTGADIYTPVVGDYRIQVNDAAMTYSLTKVGECTDNCGGHSKAETLGAVYSPQGTTFSIWSPDHSDVKVVVDGQEHSLHKVPDFNGYTDVYQVTLDGDLRLKEYSFRIDGKQVRDPYGKMAKPGTGDQAVNIVMDMSRTAPAGGWAPRPPLVEREDAVLYEAHVRDFTIDASSGVSPENRGKYMGLVEAGTSHQGVKTGLDHLEELGVTHVQLMPVFDFATCDGLPDSDPCYNWGYDPRNYNVPEERYSKVPTDYEARVREFKTMVNELHKAGIRVIMDVVYNHTHDFEMLENISGRYYTSSDLSGTGNSINADVPMVSRLIQDSLEYWVDEYGVDGFRFDLIGIFSYPEVEKWGAYLNRRFPDRNLLLYGEPWNGFKSDSKEAERVRYGTTRFLAEEHVGVFNGAYREAIKGSNDDTRKAYMFNDLNGTDSGWAIYDGFRGSPYSAEDSRNGTWFRNYAADPEQSINYISAHDNFDLWDKIYLSLSSNVTQNGDHQVSSLTPPPDLGYPKRVANFGTGIVLTSQGIPFIHSGDEFLRSKTRNEDMANASAWRYGDKYGAHNTFDAPDSFNAIRWHDKVGNAATFRYFKDLIALRRAHPGLRMNSNQEIAQYLKVNRPNSYGGQVVTGYIDNPEDGHKLFLVYNSGGNRQITLPAGSWTKIADASGAKNEGGLSGSALCEGTSVTVFRQ